MTKGAAAGRDEVSEATALIRLFRSGARLEAEILVLPSTQHPAAQIDQKSGLQEHDRLVFAGLYRVMVRRDTRLGD